VISLASGLYCRYLSCGERFNCDGSLFGIGAAARLRDDHEVSVHEYHHEKIDVSRTGALSHGGFSTKGRSTLSIKRGVLT